MRPKPARPAAPPRRPPESSVLRGWHWALLAALLVLPALALIKVGQVMHPWVPWTLALVMQAVAYVTCWRDKVKARSGKWRTPEATLHGLEFFGGWPGSYIAQRQFRHKVSKMPYQISFWVIVTIHQVVALDFLRDGEMIKSLPDLAREFLR